MRPTFFPKKIYDYINIFTILNEYIIFFFQKKYHTYSYLVLHLQVKCKCNDLKIPNGMGLGRSPKSA